MSETPQQKFQRLQHEIRELGEEVSAIQASVASETQDSTDTPVQLATQVEYLQHQLGDLHLDNMLGADAAVNLADPQGALQKSVK